MMMRWVLKILLDVNLYLIDQHVDLKFLVT